jgi:hypothetical protein
MKFTLVLGMAALVLCAAAPAGAGSNPDIELALVVQPHAPRACGAVYGDCSEMQYRLDETGSYDVIVVAYNYTGLTGLQYGLDYSGVEGATFGSFNSCTTADIHTSSVPGLYAVAQVWGACQTPPGEGAGVMVGWLELWGGAGRIDIVPDPEAGGIVAVDCGFASDAVLITHPAFVGGAEALAGDTTPCGTPLANEEVTWGGVKNLYR